jgi:hypothetical protein
MNELIEALKADTYAKAKLTKALQEQTDVMNQLVNAICLLVDSSDQEQDDGGEQQSVGQYLLDGTRIS